MRNNEKNEYWGKGSKFTHEGRTFQVKDVDVEKFYQTDFERIWLRYEVKRTKFDNGVRWVDSDDVVRVEKTRK